jgi:hypothetical protein
MNNNTTARRTFIAEATERIVNEIEADKRARGLKNPKAHIGDRMTAEARARGEYLRVEFDARLEAADANDPLTDDVRWNPNHPLAKTFDAYLAAGKSADEAEDLARKGLEPGLVAPQWPASDKQAAFVARLLDEKVYDEAEVRQADDTILFPGERREQVIVTGKGILNKAQASTLIDELLAAPRRAVVEVETKAIPVQGLDLRTLPTGNFGVPGSDGRLKVRVEHGKGKWEGWTFVKDAAEYGYGKRYGVQKPGQAYQGDIAEALTAIVADPATAAKRYGELTGRCAACNRKLEDETSVRLGIGPICRNGGGWNF